jgi:hypothetical protein
MFVDCITHRVGWQVGAIRPLHHAKKVANLARQTVEQSRQAFQSLEVSASAQSVKLKQRFGEQIELAESILSQTEQKLQGLKSIPERIVSITRLKLGPSQRETHKAV